MQSTSVVNVFDSCSCDCTVSCWPCIKVVILLPTVKSRPSLTTTTLPHCAEPLVSLHAQSNTHRVGHHRDCVRQRKRYGSDASLQLVSAAGYFFATTPIVEQRSQN